MRIPSLQSPRWSDMKLCDFRVENKLPGRQKPVFHWSWHWTSLMYTTATCFPLPILSEIQSRAVKTEEQAWKLLWTQTYARRRARIHHCNSKDHTKALIQWREMEFSFILSSLKLPFTPWPCLSKRRRKKKPCFRPGTQVLIQGGRISVSPVVGSKRVYFQYQYSEEPLANCWKCLLD